MREIQYPALAERVYQETLPNGLPVFVVRKPGFSKKCAYFATNYGSIDTKFSVEGRAFETPAGVAHYLEHKMFDLPDLDVMQAYSNLGANPNAFTSYSMTAYYFQCTEHFEECLRLLLRFVSTPYFTGESVDKERGIISQEILMYEDSPESKVYENLFAAMYRSHPVRVPIAGSVESIKDITPETLYACHRAFYNPANMVLCVVGDVDPAEVETIARQALPPEKAPECRRDYGPAEDMTCPRKEIYQEMDMAMPTFLLGFKCPDPGLGPAGFRRQILGDLAAEALMGESSPLYQRLYDEGLIDTSFGAGFETFPGAALFSCGGDTKDPRAVKAAVLEEARRVAREGIDGELFRRLKKSALGRRVRDLDSFDGLCYRICACYFDGVEYFDFPAAYAAVTKDQAEAFLRETVLEENCAMSVIAPRGWKEKA